MFYNSTKQIKRLSHVIVNIVDLYFLPVVKMNKKLVFKLCKELGCCDGCCLRYLGFKSPVSYVNTKSTAAEYAEQTSSEGTENVDVTSNENIIENNSDYCNNADNNLEQNNKENEINGDSQPPPKKRKLAVCTTCLGILQEETWDDSFNMVKEVLEKKRYTCGTFACGLSAPIATILRERSISLRLEKDITDYDSDILTPLKEAWKWSFGSKLATVIDKTLDSGSVSPLLITFNIDYLDDLQELEVLKTIAASLFKSRSQQRKRFSTEFTRRSVEQALEGVTLEALAAASDCCCLPQISGPAKCVSVVCTHAPLYLGGRYIKLSRKLPQTPWIVSGRRVMPSSVQEIIFQPLADLFGMTEAEAERRLKLIAAGREDVDVRCLAQGRPFAIEVSDPQRILSTEELQKACELISSGGEVVVKTLVPIVKEDLVLLKKGEETKTKTYEALCIKLTNSKFDNDKVDSDSPVTVTDADLHRINSYRNTPEGDEARIVITQKTPIRVLHRRPLLTRTRHIIEQEANKVPGHPQLFTLRVRTAAGTYVKEWAHGELRRTRPALPDILGASADLLALDVTAVHLTWPPEQSDKQ